MADTSGEAERLFRPRIGIDRRIFNRDNGDPRDFRLSVLVPFFGFAPQRLTEQLLGCAAAHKDEIELLLADDGSASPEYAESIATALNESQVCSTLIVLDQNVGRSTVRNILGSEALGEFVLYIDCDVEVEHGDYLTKYLVLLDSRLVDVAFGGFTMASLPAQSRQFRLHQFVSTVSHCRSAAERGAQPRKYTYASNFLLRRDLHRQQRFDERFKGWGWEDVELGFRLGEVATITQVDNPVVHHGYQSAEALIASWQASVENFELLCRQHPEKASELPIYMASSVLAWVPGARYLVGLLEWLVAMDWVGAPLTLRYWSWKLLRALVYSEIFRGKVFAARQVDSND